MTGKGAEIIIMRERYISCYSTALENNELYLFNNACGLLMKYNLEDFSYKVETQIKYNSACVKKLIKVGQNIFLVFHNKKSIVKYNLDKQITEIYGREDTYLEKHQKIWDAFIFDSNIWSFPTYVSSKISFFNIRTKKQDEYMSIRDLFELKGINLESEDYVSNLHQRGKEIWAAVCGTPYVFLFDLADEEIQIFDTKCGDITSFHYIDKEFWIYTAKERCVINWRPEFGQREKYNIDIRTIIREDESYLFIYSTYNKIFLIPYLDYSIIVIEKKLGTCSLLKLAEHCFRVNDNLSLSLFGTYLIQKDKLILLPNVVNQIVICSLIDNSLEFREGKLHQQDYERYYLLEQLDVGNYIEADEYTLEQFIRILKLYYKEKKSSSREIAGKKIYESV